LARRLRALPTPVIGRIEGGHVLLDLRCLEDETGFLDQLGLLSRASGRPRESGEAEPATGSRP